MLLGFWLIIIAQTLWGALPLYYLGIKSFEPIVIVAFRIFISFVFLIFIIVYKKEFRKLLNILKSKDTVFGLFISASFLMFNWFIFVYALSINRVIEASLGYFIYPLINVTIGAIFFKDKLNRIKKVAVFFSLIAVLYLCFLYGYFPWIGLGLAFSFSFYGAIRKKSIVNSIQSLTVETMLFVPLAIVLFFLNIFNQQQTPNIIDWSWLFLIGPLTVIPLILFVSALKLLPLSFAGMISYLGPTIQFITGLFLGEKLDRNKIIAFILIWFALFIYSFASINNKYINRFK